MFVSSYATFIQSHSLNKTEKIKDSEGAKESFTRYSDLQKEYSSKNSQAPLNTTKELPLSYISNYKVINNQQKLQHKEQETKHNDRFKEIKTLKSAQQAYTQNSVLFASLREPKVTLSQTPFSMGNLSDTLHKAQLRVFKQEMINTYKANQEYYIRAA